jgi:hypothetical protein
VDRGCMIGMRLFLHGNGYSGDYIVFLCCAYTAAFMRSDYGL